MTTMSGQAQKFSVLLRKKNRKNRQKLYICICICAATSWLAKSSVRGYTNIPMLKVSSTDVCRHQYRSEKKRNRECIENAQTQANIFKRIY